MVSIYDTVAAITVVAVIKLSQVKVVRGLSVRKTNAATFKQAVDRNPDIWVGEIQ